MLAASKLFVLGTRIAVDEQMETLDHFVQVGRVDGLQCDANNRTAL
jgi:hypothetical protein